MALAQGGRLPRLAREAPAGATAGIRVDAFLGRYEAAVGAGVSP